MKAKQTALSLSTTPARKRTTHPNKQSYAMQHIGFAWRGLSGTQRATWQALTQTLSTPGVVGVKANHSAYGRFFAHNSTLLAAQQPILAAAPATPGDVFMPPAHLAASLTGGVLTLTVTPETPFTGFKTLVFATAPLLAGQSPLQGRRYKQIGMLDTLTGPTDVSALYLSKFRVLGPGYQIALQLVGIDAAGFRSAPVTTTAVAG